jgi:coenzyme F420-reducing hydrogenase gamma subunit
MKPKVAFFDFASCEGCQLQVVNLEEKVLDLVDVVEVVSFREAMKEHSDGYDIAFVEGSIMRPMDEERLKKIRSNAKLLVALGACACIGGVNKLRNKWPVAEVKTEVYGDAQIAGNPYFDVFPTKSLDEVVAVDARVPGCPINRNEFAKTVTWLTSGRKPRLPNFPVCVECKKNENVCVFERGQFCLGPITRAGCNSICPSNGEGCDGCRGFLEDLRVNAMKDVLRRHDVSLDQMVKRFSLYNYKREGY